MIRVVADTNVLASGLAGYDALEGPAAYLLRAWQQRRFDLVASGPIFEELERTLAKPYFSQRLGLMGAWRALDFIREGALWVIELADVRGVATTPADDLILATAVAGGASHLVTGDRQLLNLGEYRGVRIVGPRAFVDWLARGWMGTWGQKGRGKGRGSDEEWVGGEEGHRCARGACVDGVAGCAGIEHGAGSRLRTPG